MHGRKSGKSTFLQPGMILFRKWNNWKSFKI